MLLVLNAVPDLLRLTRPALLLCASVYLALWNETPVAVKVLMRNMSPIKPLDVEEDAEAAANAAMSLSTPILASLQKVGGACGLVDARRHVD